MCPPNPFPLKPTCVHTYDRLDREIVLFLISNEGERFSVGDLQEKVLLLPIPEYNELWSGYFKSSYGRDLVRRRLNLLEKEGLTGKLNGWLWTITSKAKEAHCLWLWSNVADVA